MTYSMTYQNYWIEIKNCNKCADEYLQYVSHLYKVL